VNNIAENCLVVQATSGGLRKTPPPVASTVGVGKAEQTVRAELRRLQARYDGGAIPPAIFSVVRSLETELAWIEHGKRSCAGDSQ
jgi:hypothetical protein